MIDIGSFTTAQNDGRFTLSFPLKAPAWVGLRQPEFAVGYPAGCRPEGSLGDVALWSILPFAFWVGAHIRLDSALALSSETRANAAAFCRLLGQWYRRPFDLSILGGSPAVPARPSQGKTALFFSGGSDSLATYLRHRDEVDELVFVRGADLYLRPDRLDVEAKYQSVIAPLRAFAGEEGKEFIEISTSVREAFGFRYRGEIWSYAACGSATVAPLLGLVGRYSRAWLASSGSGQYERVIPHGGRAEIVAAMNTAAIATAVPDVAVSRAERLRLIVAEPRLLACLRVCSAETPAYNCGRCKKCRQTIAGLLALGVQPGQAPFPPETFNFEHLNRWAENKREAFFPGVYWSHVLHALENSPAVPPPGRQFASLMRSSLPFYERWLRGEMPGASDALYPRLPARPNLLHRLIGFPALNHGSFVKWLKGRLRVRLGRQRLSVRSLKYDC